MSVNRNKETKQNLSHTIKALQGRCLETCHIIENAPQDLQITAEEADLKTIAYLEGLRTELQASHTPIVTDANLLTIQFMNDMKDKVRHLEELVAFTRGALMDVETEINRLKSQIKTVQEARNRPLVQNRKVRPEHLEAARTKFRTLKNELHGLITSLFPDKDEEMKQVLCLLLAHQHDDSPDYMEITSKIFPLIEILSEKKIISVNPYNKMEVKLAYSKSI